LFACWLRFLANKNEHSYKKNLFDNILLAVISRTHMKKLMYLLSYAILRATCFVLTLLPLNFSYGLAKFLGNFAYHILRLRRRVVMDNLHTAFAREMPEAQIKEIAAESYRQIGMSFVELLVAPKLQEQIQHILEPKHFSLIQRSLHEGKGLITVSGHLGNWELQGAAAATAMSQPFTVAAVQQSNPFINRFITRRRNDMGMQVAGTKEAMKLLLRALRNKQAIGLVADQNAGRNAVFVDFFGKSAATHPGPAQLALKFGAPMLVGAAIRTGPGQFKILSQQVEINADDTVETLTQRHVKILEGFIRQHPEQYFWLHRRWKTRPAEEIEDLRN
jgi:KDO2-lipid IV(A) lauroyltransferase